VPCALAGRDKRLLKGLLGRPSVIYITDIGKGADNALGRLVGSLQEGYFYWITWAGLVVGEAGKEEIRSLHSGAPFKFEHCFGDREGRILKALGVRTLPALVLVNEEGFIVERYESADENTVDRIAGGVDRLARASSIKGKRVRDFRLPEVKSRKLLTLLDVAGDHYTMLAFLHTGSPAFLSQLKMLEEIRDKYRDHVALVAIFQEETEAGKIVEYLDGAGVSPDYVIHDPKLGQARRYGVAYVPVLLVAGPDGMIAMSRKGYQPERSWYFSGDLDRFFLRETARVEETAFTESRRIHEEALQYLEEGQPEMALMFLLRILELSPDLSTTHIHIAEAYRKLGRRQEAARHYGFYVATNPGAYDIPQVQAELRALVETKR
jgi:tetratricopeptide (TPR) repeat protein